MNFRSIVLEIYGKLLPELVEKDKKQRGKYYVHPKEDGRLNEHTTHYEFCEYGFTGMTLQISSNKRQLELSDGCSIDCGSSQSFWKDGLTADDVDFIADLINVAYKRETKRGVERERQVAQRESLPKEFHFENADRPIIQTIAMTEGINSSGWGHRSIRICTDRGIIKAFMFLRTPISEVWGVDYFLENGGSVIGSEIDQICFFREDTQGVVRLGMEVEVVSNCFHVDFWGSSQVYPNQDCSEVPKRRNTESRILVECLGDSFGVDLKLEEE